MGAWGYGHFEDDAALDFMQEIEEADDPKQAIVNAFDTAISSEYLEAYEGSAAIVGATYIDRQLNGTRYSTDPEDEPLAVDTFPDRHPGQDLSPLRHQAVEALQQVLAGHSELNELWAENDADYPAWQQGVQQLMERLKA